MLLEFSVANFQSFRDKQRFSMLAAPKRSNDSGLDEANVFEVNGIRMLKTKGIYGQNASGKSSLIKAIYSLKLMVSNSVANEQLPARIWNDRFKLLLNWDDQPMFFEIVFMQNNTIYRYGFQLKNNIVDAEWLFRREDATEKKMFTRTQENGMAVTGEFHGASEFVNLLEPGSHEIFRKDSLFITGTALMGNVQAIEIRDAIRSITLMNGISDKWSQEATKNILLNAPDVDKQVLIELLQAAEIGTRNLSIESSQQGTDENEDTIDIKSASDKKIVTHKTRYDEEGNAVDFVEGFLNTWESAGTQKWLYTSTAIVGTLVYGRTLVIDEFDARFHPNLTLKIVNLFNNPRTNPHNAQLIFATHDTGLLRRAKLRRDQICFVDKDKYGVSTSKTLIEYKGVRKDESYEKEYLEGSYGAVAYLDDIDNIIADFLKRNDGLSETK